ncbi:MAG: hypothetical protein ACOWW1_05275 [archaeon]|nr:hypothetical protein [Candidatus Bathyarchaeum sp.]
MIKTNAGVMNDKIDGDVLVDHSGVYTIKGMITGSLEVQNTAQVIVEGLICKDVIVNDLSKVLVTGMVNGSIIVNGGAFELSGMVLGDVIRKKGVAQIQENAVIRGAVIEEKQTTS